MTDSILSIRALTRRYGAVTALDNINLDVAQGEFLALLGPSGCGKTTLLRCIAGFAQPSSGEVLIESRAVQGVPAHRRPVNTVFQNYALFPHMTVAANVAYGLQRAGVGKAETAMRVAEMLELVGLPDHGARYPAQLSGGQQQRVALARAIVNRPKVLLLDEPLGALDLKLRKHMQIELKRLQEQLGITFVFVTHDQEEALVMANRIAVMNAGRIEQIGTGADIYRTPSSLFVADFIGEANLIDVRAHADGALTLGADGQPVGVLPQAAQPGRYRLLARPEQLAFLGPDSAAPALAFDATVTRTIFVGDALRVYARLADASEVAIKLPDGPRQRAPHSGAQVRVGWFGQSPTLFAAAA
ncbi:ABC transporter ATP-binding protein [Bordetella bronchiseptica]|uniref:ABC transporter ATP-binding protein n=1 Tax=Bordetella bronchiseptica TaxID=518 RepID=UPI0004596BA1|nr:ABC transporter ATP-binding protein [Bordetella bronchiseptica]KCV59040.1 polyamine ABC transporter, ATP-binding protein [Bordetella bronchiseptica 99-R-0433]MBN3267012.1 ABC transporter ATP-binding protein [Bordetella bronchiseptica]